MIGPSVRQARLAESGFSLAEVIIALALLAAVMISVAGMFTLGVRQVYSGRCQSAALAVARDILEEMNSWSFHQTYEMYGLAGGADSHTPVDSRVNVYAQRWQPALEMSLQDSHAEIEIGSVAQGVPPDLERSRAIRVEVTVFWREALRERNVQLAMVRM